MQHFAFCPRQWALIHIERQWIENGLTAEGRTLHERAHDASASEKRGDLLILRDLRIHSARLGISGACDVVEFRLHPDGVPLHGRAGAWLPYPVEYKRGSPKPHDADALQLCAQAMCIEEMLCCSVPEGALFYGETRRRQEIACTSTLRNMVEQMLEQMHDYADRGYTPHMKPHKGCANCSLRDICLPKLRRIPNARAYLRSALEEVRQCEDF